MATVIKTVSRFIYHRQWDDMQIVNIHTQYVLQAECCYIRIDEDNFSPKDIALTIDETPCQMLREMVLYTNSFSALSRSLATSAICRSLVGIMGGIGVDGMFRIELLVDNDKQTFSRVSLRSIR